jgi:hypothetical protein
MKKIFTLLSAVLFSASTQAQVIGMIGDFTSWASDVVMTTTDNVNWTVTNQTFLISGGVKFRQDADWAVNFGSLDFPVGVGVQGGDNIPVPAGTFDVAFNSSTGAYTFTAVATGFEEIGFFGGFNTFGANEPMVTADGTQYTKLDFQFTAPDVKFRNTTTSSVYGGTAFPSGTAVLNGGNIPLTAGFYNVGFDKSTLAYGFQQVPVGIIGSAIFPNDWSVDVPMNSTDGGVSFSLNGYTITDGVCKFRANQSWATNWGGVDFPVGVATAGAGDIPVAAGIYDISFNRVTGEYNFAVAGVEEIGQISAVAFPNPATDVVTFQVAATDYTIVLTDLSGKVISTSTNNSVDMSNLTAGTYVYKIISATGFATGKLMKK